MKDRARIKLITASKYQLEEGASLPIVPPNKGGPQVVAKLLPYTGYTRAEQPVSSRMDAEPGMQVAHGLDLSRNCDLNQRNIDQNRASFRFSGTFRVEHLMTDLEKILDNLNSRLSAMHDGIETEFSALLAEIDQVHRAADQLQSAGDDRVKRLKQLEERTKAQNELVETLTEEAAEVRVFREEVRERDLEIERLNSALKTKDDLMKGLNSQLKEVDQLKAKVGQSEKKVFEQQYELDRQQKALDRAARDVAVLQDELDARKTMITSLKADTERAESLGVQLEAKREAIDSLEGAIDQHVETISELRHSVDAWKAKYKAAKGEEFEDYDQTMTELPIFAATETDEHKNVENAQPNTSDQTVAIDMRDVLEHAQRDKTRAGS